VAISSPVPELAATRVDSAVSASPELHGTHNWFDFGITPIAVVGVFLIPGCLDLCTLMGTVM